MGDIWQRFVENLLGRWGGPMSFRFILQPVAAMIFAIVRGVQDARLGKPPYGWALVSDPEHRKELLKDGWKQAGRVFIFAVVLDLGYQLYVQHAFYPGETLVVAFVLAIVPYVIVRGLVNRIARLFYKKPPEIQAASRDKLAS